nr:hypothetical protein [Mycobacterium uberis]
MVCNVAMVRRLARCSNVQLAACSPTVGHYLQAKERSTAIEALHLYLDVVMPLPIVAGQPEPQLLGQGSLVCHAVHAVVLVAVTTRDYNRGWVIDGRR